MTTPRDEPQQQPCRCETCECGKKRVRILYPNGEEKTRLVKCSKLNQTLTHEEVDIVSIVGCFSHSANTGTQARIDAVVKELEKAVKKSEGDLDGTRNTEIAYRNGMLRAIALLKEGVGE